MNTASVLKRAALAVLLTCGLSQYASAVVLLPNTTVGLPGTTVAARPELAGVVLEDVLQPFSFVDSSGHTLSGAIQNRVVRSSLDGTLDFYWRIRDTTGTSASGDPGAISAFRVGGFGNFALDADWRIDGLGTTNPVNARRFPDPGFVNFLFGDTGLVPDDESVFFFLDTQETAYAKRGSYDLTGTGGNGISASYSTFAPVPEPSSFAIVAAGFGVIAFIVRRRLGVRALT
jgi:hypothetical protein